METLFDIKKINTFYVVFLLLSICSAIYSDGVKNNLQQKCNQLSEREILQEIDKNKKELKKEDISIDEKVKILLKINSLCNSIGQYEESVKVLEKFIDNYKGIKEEPRLLLILGMNYVMLGKIAQASDVFVKIIKEYPNDEIVKYAEKELELLKNRNFVNLMDDGRKELSYIKNLTIAKGWSHVIKTITKFSVYRFLLVGFFILMAIILSRNNNTKLINSSIKKSSALEQNYWAKALLLAFIFIFSQPVFRVLYLFGKYGIKGHFYAYSYIATHLMDGTRDIYLVDFLSGIIGIILILCILKREKIIFKDLFFKSVPYLKNILLSVLLIISVCFTLKYLWIILVKLFSCKETIQQILFSYSNKKYLSAFIYIGLFVPFMQELFFRGIFLQVLIEKIKLPYALILNSLAFSLYYLRFDLSQIVFFFIYGLILGLMYKKLGLFSCITLHSLLIISKI